MRNDESFSFMTPQGHMFAGMNTFSAETEDGVTVVQIQALIRASDPIYEVLPAHLELLSGRGFTYEIVRPAAVATQGKRRAAAG